MAPSIVYGDAEALVVGAMRAQLDDDTVTVSVDLVGYDEAGRWVTVTRIGGDPTPYFGLDRPMIAVDVYAPDKADAFDLAQAARAAVFAARGYAGTDCVLYDVGDASGFTWIEDAEVAAHYTFTLSIVTRPTT
jgi:hypothetical protein